MDVLNIVRKKDIKELQRLPVMVRAGVDDIKLEVNEVLGGTVGDIAVPFLVGKCELDSEVKVKFHSSPRVAIVIALSSLVLNYKGCTYKELKARVCSSIFAKPLARDFGEETIAPLIDSFCADIAEYTTSHGMFLDSLIHHIVISDVTSALNNMLDGVIGEQNDMECDVETLLNFRENNKLVYKYLVKEILINSDVSVVVSDINRGLAGYFDIQYVHDGYTNNKLSEQTLSRFVDLYNFGDSIIEISKVAYTQLNLGERELYTSFATSLLIKSLIGGEINAKEFNS